MRFVVSSALWLYKLSKVIKKSDAQNLELYYKWIILNNNVYQKLDGTFYLKLSSIGFFTHNNYKKISIEEYRLRVDINLHILKGMGRLTS